MSVQRALLRLALCAGIAACTPQWYDLANDPAPDAGGPRRDAAAQGGRGGSDATITPPPVDGAMPEPDAGPFVPVARCGNVACACDDGKDNDGDLLVDGFDPECTGALDEDESSFATGKEPKVKPCRDCFWDEDMGTGNDPCRYPSECLRGEAPRGAGNCSSCEVSAACLDTCAERTPPGCDCFGCCGVVRPNGATVFVELTDRCSLASLDDPAACPPCYQSTQCRNTCDRCELCPGRTVRDLPADCRTGAASYRCDPLLTVCATSGDCTTDQYCQLGCCFTLLL